MNIEQIRQDTPNCKDKIFLNSAGASLIPKIVVHKVNEYLIEEEKIGGYKLEELRKSEFDEFYNEVAKLIHCEAHNIAFINNATDGYIKALSCIDFKEDDTVITTDDDYASNHIHFIALQKRYHINVVRIKTFENGELDIEDFETLIKMYRTKLVSISHIPTNSGLIQNVKAIGNICEKNNIIFLLDACQSVGQIVVDVKPLKCDFLTATGRKFLRGPRGTGFLYVSDKILKEQYAPLYIDGRGATWTEIYKFEMLDSAKRFELWESPCAFKMGFQEAIKYANNIGMEHIQAYNEKIMKQLRANLSSIPNVVLFDKGLNTSNILTFRKGNVSLKRISNILDKNKVYYSVSNKEWGLIDFNKKGIEWAIRLSPHYFNTIEEMDKVSQIIENI